jgi:hypothetical protein
MFFISNNATVDKGSCECSCISRHFLLMLEEGERVRVWGVVVLKVLALNHPVPHLLGVADDE